jgi:hypothetical protein
LVVPIIGLSRNEAKTQKNRNLSAHQLIAAALMEML